MMNFGAQIGIGENEMTEFKYAFDEGAENICTSKVAACKKIVHFAEWIGKWEEKFV